MRRGIDIAIALDVSRSMTATAGPPTPADAAALGSLAASEVIAHWGPRPMVKRADLAVTAGLKL